MARPRQPAWSDWNHTTRRRGVGAQGQSPGRLAGDRNGRQRPRVLSGALLVLGAAMCVPGTWLLWQAGKFFVITAGGLVLASGLALWQARRSAVVWLALAGLLALVWAGMQPGMSWQQGLRQVDVLLIACACTAWRWPRLDARVPPALGRTIAASLAVLLLWCWSAPAEGPDVWPASGQEPAAAPSLPPPMPAPDEQAWVAPARAATG